MKSVMLARIEIDEKGQLRLSPLRATYGQIYRAGDGVEWDAKGGFLHIRGPDEWSYSKRFRKIVASVESEYGVLLEVGPTTEWKNVPEEICREISLQNEKKA